MSSPANDRHELLAFGAAGRIAGPMPRELARRGVRGRGCVRDEDQRAGALANGVQDVAIGDLSDPAIVAAAMTGVAAILCIAPVDLRGQGAIGRRIVEHAAAAGVRRFVLSSVIPCSTCRSMSASGRVEAALGSSGPPYMILHPAVRRQQFDTAGSDIVPRQVLAEPWSNETRHARVDDRGVADSPASAPLVSAPRVDGSILSLEWKEAAWDRYVTGAPRPRTPSEQLQRWQASLATLSRELG